MSDSIELESLSSRGQSLVARPPMPEYLIEHHRRSSSLFDSIMNPNGYIPLCIAENRQVSEMVLARLAECKDLPLSVLGYDAMIGSLRFRQQLGRFMERTFLGRYFEPQQIAVLSGAGRVGTPVDTIVL